MTEYLMCIHRGHMCIFIPNMKFLPLILWLGGLCTHADDADTNADDDNYPQRRNHDYIGSFGITPNEPKIRHMKSKSNLLCPIALIGRGPEARS